MQRQEAEGSQKGNFQAGDMTRFRSVQHKARGQVGQARSVENIPASFLVTANKHFVVSLLEGKRNYGGAWLYIE